jgi:hypothetical protein
MAHPSVADRLAFQPWTGTRPTSDWLSCARDMAERKHEHYIHRIPRLNWHPYIDEKVRTTSKKHRTVECLFANSDKTFSGRDPNFLLHFQATLCILHTTSPSGQQLIYLGE